MFKTFPEFTKLTLDDRDEYESYIKDFPPMSDIVFPSIMVWWGSMDGLAVSRLNDNLVMSYWIPGDEVHSGLSLIGTNKVDESVCAVFDYLRERQEEPRLVNVPDFVVNAMRYSDMFKFSIGRGDDEYLIRLSRFARVENMPMYMRVRARKFMQDFSRSEVKVEPLKMDLATTKQTLLDAVKEWPQRGINNINKLERSVLPIAVDHAHSLGIRGVGLYIDGVLQAYCLYFPTFDSDYTIVAHARVNYEIPRIFDYMAHAFCKYLVEEEGYVFINLHADNDSQKLRAIKIALKPDGFFHKYSIEPA